MRERHSATISSTLSSARRVGGPWAALAFTLAISAFQRLDSRSDLGLVGDRPDLRELGLDLAEQLERRRQDGYLFSLNELLDPPERIVSLGQARQRLPGARELIEGPCFLRLADLLRSRTPS